MVNNDFYNSHILSRITWDFFYVFCCDKMMKSKNMDIKNWEFKWVHYM